MMILRAIIDEQVYSLNVPDALLAQGEDFFTKLDADMDQGWQMSRDWVQQPNRVQRCQIVADKLLTALENENEKTGRLMAAYILSRLPDVDTVDIDIRGEIQNTEFSFRDPSQEPAPQQVIAAPPPEAASGGGDKLQAMEQAGNDVTKVFKVGKGYRFSVFDHASSQWSDSPLIATEQEAERLRQQAFKERFEALQRGAIGAA